ncbi:MAG: AI-2E family transporter [Bacteroidales bacterium]|jgi:predicted PurR-regulated permease PerM|nr:AI-2E family transporter [Bacteroidales bacterium]
MKVNINAGVVIQVCAILLLLVLAWHFSNLVLYIFLAFIFSLIGKPIAQKISGIRICKWYLPYGVSSLLTMIVLILFFGLILFFFVPMLTREAQVIAGINYDDLSRNLSYLLNNVQDFLYTNNLIDEHETLVGLVTTEIKNFVSLTNFSNLLGGVMSATGSFLMGLFAVFFLTFFFIKDDVRFDGLAQLLFGERHAGRLAVVSGKINHLLSRYFIGLLIEIASMIGLLYVGMAIFGVKGALLMAFFGGMLNAIPYLGPLIGVMCSCLFGAVDCISINDYQAILPTMLQIAGTFIGANLIDNIVLQPLIYSQSVKAHPIEIFLVIILGGSLAGIIGMLFAIPVYTIIRTIVIELFHYANTKQS